MQSLILDGAHSDVSLERHHFCVAACLDLEELNSTDFLYSLLIHAGIK